MKILSMTATFGKLNRSTLTLNPGLNIIQAPNEWGKSTWCAFLVAMLYGIDTNQRTSQSQLADKEHYAPWSGLPMSGRLEILWNGKRITIERHTKGRVPMGEFSAYETDSGIPVPELTADHCGQALLGVERSVFLRSGFIRQADLPVTSDDALRRRLNALVTTGDETNAGDLLAKKLKELKNSCRYNKSGALPQAEAQREQLKSSLAQLSALRSQLEQTNGRQADLQQQLERLENHRQALAFDRSTEGLYRLNQAKDARKAAEEQVAQLQAQVDQLPERIHIDQDLARLRQLMAEKATLESRPIPEDAPYHHAIFGELSPETALEHARSHKAAWDQVQKPGPLLPVLAGICLAAGIGLSFLWSPAWLPGLALAAVFMALYLRKGRKNARIRQLLAAPYGALPPEQWVPVATEYMRQDAAAKAVSENHWQRIQLVKQLLEAQTGDLSPEEAEKKWQGHLDLYSALAQAQESARQAALREADLQAAVKPVSPAPQTDMLDLTEEATDRAIAQVTVQLQELHQQIGQWKGQIDALKPEDVIRQQLAAVETRIAQLTDLYEASVLALSHLEQAALQLQQRFAPQLTATARDYFATLTGNRYDRLLLDQQLQLQAGAADEDGLRAPRWRSDGTVDQLYLALRLAVSQQLTPQAPLVLDDALVRFDDTRHSAAMDLLRQQSQEKQILLFTCQSREGAYSPESVINI